MTPQNIGNEGQTKQNRQPSTIYVKQTINKR